MKVLTELKDLEKMVYLKKDVIDSITSMQVSMRIFKKALKEKNMDIELVSIFSDIDLKFYLDDIQSLVDKMRKLLDVEF